MQSNVRSSSIASRKKQKIGANQSLCGKHLILGKYSQEKHRNDSGNHRCKRDDCSRCGIVRHIHTSTSSTAVTLHTFGID